MRIVLSPGSERDFPDRREFDHAHFYARYFVEERSVISSFSNDCGNDEGHVGILQALIEKSDLLIFKLKFN